MRIKIISKLHKFRFILEITSILLSFPLVILGVDLFTRKIFEDYKAKVEMEIENQLERPMTIGVYKGFSPWTLNLDSLMIGTGSEDKSTISVKNLELMMVPIGNIYSNRLRLNIRCKRVESFLRRNRKGDYLILRPSKEKMIPHLDLNLIFIEPTTFHIYPSIINFFLEAKTRIRFDKSFLKIKVELDLLKNGHVTLFGKGYWKPFDMSLRIGIDDLQLFSLKLLNKNTASYAPYGKLSGDIYTTSHRKKISCIGNLNLENFKIKSNSGKTLYNKFLKLFCHNNILQIERSDWQYGKWSIIISGQFLLYRWFQIFLVIKDEGTNYYIIGKLYGSLNQVRLQISAVVKNFVDPLIMNPLHFQVDIFANVKDKLKNAFFQIHLAGKDIQLKASGSLFPHLNLETKLFQLETTSWERLSIAKDLLGFKYSLQGNVTVTGAWNQPTLYINLAQLKNPLLDNWEISWKWNNKQLELMNFRSPGVILKMETIPVFIGSNGLVLGDVKVRVDIHNYYLHRIDALTNLYYKNLK
uniref:AsmA-like C-terminal domain-containing protein n=1 Tax=Paulinella chromatophora TaxID=39717 RepID=B1X5Q9_PAUCH|nr:hypothetical protein PCC_0868 [Paulinella chromatophora]ACB43278.1 hypothetical protein PCC_0868 [Paulinella chromatophora]